MDAKQSNAGRSIKKTGALARNIPVAFLLLIALISLMDRWCTPSCYFGAPVRVNDAKGNQEVQGTFIYYLNLPISRQIVAHISIHAS